MTITYTDAVKQARMDAVTSEAGTTAVLEIGTAAMAAILATIPLANPIAPAATGAGVLTLTPGGMQTTNAEGSGTAVEARIRTATAGTDIITGLTVTTVATGTGDIQLDSTTISATQTVTISSAVLTHAA